MALLSSSPGQASGAAVVIDGLTKSNPSVVNVTFGVAGTETEIVLPAGVAEFEVQARGLSKLQYSYTAGQTSLEYGTIYPGKSYRETRLFVTAPLSIFVAASKDGEVVEVTIWTT